MKRARPIVAIDGPMGSGKSTVARELARALGFVYLNTGAMYRAVAIEFRDAGIRSSEQAAEEKIAPILRALEISFNADRVILNGDDVSAAIGSPEVSDLASRFSTIGAVRQRMREIQRAAGEKGGVVMEGRDIGTAVFPDAEFKFYLDADPKVRAERRYAELRASGVKIDRDQVMQQLIERDRRDTVREIAPLKRADDAIVIDTTNMTIAQAVNALKERIQGGFVPQRA